MASAGESSLSVDLGSFTSATAYAGPISPATTQIGSRSKPTKPGARKAIPATPGFAWYRRHIRIVPSAGGFGKLAILMPPVDDGYELYWNGMKIGSQGSLPPHAVWYVGHRQSFAFPVSAAGSQDGVLALRVWKAPLASFEFATGGGLSEPPILGDSAVIAAIVGEGDFQRMRASLYGRALSFLFLLSGTVSFIFWIRNREQRLFLWFAVRLLDKVSLSLLLTDRATDVFSPTTFNCSLYAVYTIEDIAVFLLLLYLFDLQDNHRVRRWTAIIIAIESGTALTGGILFLFWENAGPTLQWADAIVTVVNQLSELFVVVLAYQGLKRKTDLPRKLVAVMAFLVYLHETVSGLSPHFSHALHQGGSGCG